MGMMLAKLNAEVTVIEFADSVLAASILRSYERSKKKMKKLGMKTSYRCQPRTGSAQKMALSCVSSKVMS